MSVKNSTGRAALLKIANLIRPALATQDYIPALTHIKFDGQFATAYNDISAIVVQAEVDIKRCVPGDLLIRALGSFGGETVALAYDDKNSSLLLSSGRSKLKLPTMPTADFPFEVPSDQAPEITMTKDMIKGIEQCLLSVGNDPTHPAQMGVTLEVDGEGRAVMFSTDNFTISRYQTSTKIVLSGDTPVIMPTFFCVQLIAIAKAFPECEVVLVMLPGALLADFLPAGKSTTASLFTKTIVDLEPLDFHKIVKKHCDPVKVVKDLITIPDALDAAFERALLVLTNELDKSTEVIVSPEGIDLHSTSAMGDSDDEIDAKIGTSMKFLVDPTLVVRGTKQASKIGFYPRVMVLANESASFLHLIAHCAS